MATGTYVPVEVYLRTSDYEPDAEYRDGEILERPVGELNHADWQGAICAFFLSHVNNWKVRVFPELRVQVAESRYCVPDVTVLDRSQPVEQIITYPPIAVFEILSPEDRVLRLRQKLTDYAAMGIPQIWVINPGKTPEATTFEGYLNGLLAPASRFEQGQISFAMPEITAYLQG